MSLSASLKFALARVAHVLASRHWTRLAQGSGADRRDWWYCPRVVAHVNQKLCGEPLAELGAAAPVLLRREFPGRIFNRAISVGSGIGSKEMRLVECGLVGEFHLYELSRERVELGRRLAAERSLGGRMLFHCQDGMASPPTGDFDLVYWNNALHQMLDTEAAIQWSHSMLRSGGVLYVEDFVGPDRMQWTRESLRVAARVRRALPARYFSGPFSLRSTRRRAVRRPLRLAMILKDPTECADSARILPSVLGLFPEAGVVPLGGTIYYLALGAIAHEIEQAGDHALMDRLLRIDDRCTARGEFLYAAAVGQKT